MGRLFSVDGEMLRGSGRLLTHSAGAILNVRPNDNVTFTDEHGHAVTITFPNPLSSGHTLGRFAR